MHMTKIISLTDAVYMKLKGLKKNKSFSREIDELLESSSKKGDVKELMKYFGSWSKAEGERFQREIARSRKRAVPRSFG